MTDLDSATPTEELGEAVQAPEHSEGGEAATAASETNDQLYTVKVGGQESRVSLDELVNGYQRQSDYTRGKQEVAELRRELQNAEILWRAVQENPKETIPRLQEHFRDQLADAEDLDPTEAQLRELQQNFSQFQRAQQEQQLQTQIETELSGLHKRYGEFDDNDLLRHAVENNIANLDAAYAHRAHVERFAREQKEGQSQAAADAANRRKRDASFIEGGTSASRGASRDTVSDFPTIRAAYEATLTENRS